MCTNMRRVRNKYTGDVFYVTCGHCKACQQAKSFKRVRRIRDNLKDGYLALSVMLSYDRFSVPYVYRTDVEKLYKSQFGHGMLNVYRDSSVRFVRSSVGYVVKPKRFEKRVLLTIRDCTFNKSSYFDLPNDLNKSKGKIGVLYYKDIQDFNKRLKQNLIRNFSHDGQYSYFVTGEYGEHTLRCHWHLLIFCRSRDVEIFRSAIIKSWLFGDMRKERRIEIAKNMASYVASYVNCGSDFPAFLSENFPPKCHYSKGFGCGQSCFSVNSLLEKVNRGDLRRDLPSRESPTGYTSVLMPKYVINRFFPIFKGYSRLVDSTVYNLLSSLDGNVLCYDPRYKEIDYSRDDINAITIRLRHCYRRYFVETGRNLHDYAIDFQRVWTCYKSNVLMMNHCRVDAPPLHERYYNLFELIDNQMGLKGYCIDDPIQDFVEVDPNHFKSVIENTARLAEYYDNLSKYKKVNNFVVSKNDEEF